MTIACHESTSTRAVRNAAETADMIAAFLEGARCRRAEAGLQLHGDLPTCHHGDPGERRIGRIARRPLFRSYAGITRIRFKGPAHRHLSAVRRPPRNEAIYVAERRRCQARRGPLRA